MCKEQISEQEVKLKNARKGSPHRNVERIIGKWRANQASKSTLILTVTLCRRNQRTKYPFINDWCLIYRESLKPYDIYP